MVKLETFIKITMRKDNMVKLSANIKDRISLIVPAYNEEEGLRKTVTEALPFVSEIIIVDDCSKDGTYKEALILHILLMQFRDLLKS